MKNKGVIESYFAQKDNKALDVTFIVLTVLGALLTGLFLFMRFGWGFFGIPILLVGLVGSIFYRSSRTTDEDYDKEVERIMRICGVEEEGMTLKQFMFEENCKAKTGKDNKVRSTFYSVTNFTFVDEVCTVRQNVIDLSSEKTVRLSEFKVPVGCSCELTEEECAVGEESFKMTFLGLNGAPEIKIPVDTGIYDTDAVIKRVSRR